jgi:hypothetical protein
MTLSIVIWVIVGVLSTIAVSTLFLTLAGVIHSWPYDMTFHTLGR